MSGDEKTPAMESSVANISLHCTPSLSSVDGDSDSAPEQSKLSAAHSSAPQLPISKSIANFLTNLRLVAVARSKNRSLTVPFCSLKSLARPSRTDIDSDRGLFRPSAQNIANTGASLRDTRPDEATLSTSAVKNQHSLHQLPLLSPNQLSMLTTEFTVNSVTSWTFLRHFHETTSASSSTPIKLYENMLNNENAPAFVSLYVKSIQLTMPSTLKRLTAIETPLMPLTPIGRSISMKIIKAIVLSPLALLTANVNTPTPNSTTLQHPPTTFDAAVDLCCDVTFLDHAFIDAMLLFYREFVTPRALLEMLMTRYQRALVTSSIAEQERFVITALLHFPILPVLVASKWCCNHSYRGTMSLINEL